MINFKYIKHKKQFYLGFGFKIIEVLLELCLPIFMASLMTYGFKEGKIEQAYLMFGLIIIFSVLGYLSTVFAHNLTARVSQNYAYQLRKALFNNIQDMGLEDVNEFSPTTLTNRINTDVNHIQNGLAMTMRIASRAPVLMIGSLIALYIISFKVALVLTISLPIIIFVLMMIMKVSMRSFKTFQEENDDLITVVKDNSEGARMIRAFAQVEHEETRFKRKNERLSKTMIHLGKITSLSSPFTILSMNVVLVIMIYFGALDVNLGTLSQEQLIQIINYVTQLTLAIISTMNLVLLYTKAQAASIRVKAVLNKENTIKNKKDGLILDNQALDIEFKNVTFTYKGHSQPTLENINLKIYPGQTVGIVGLTGSGKTTLVDLLLRFFDVTKGSILLNGHNIKSYDIHHLRNHIAYALQKPSLLSGTVEKNIQMNQTYNETNMLEALNHAQANFISDYPEKTKTLVYQGGNNFSGGQKQRLSLARAFIKDAGLLILDDTFSALDYLTDQEIRKELSKETKQTKIIISQRLSSIKQADQIIVLSEGQIDATGTHEELLAHNKLYQKLYQTQTKGDDDHVKNDL